MSNTDANSPKWVLSLKSTIRPILTYAFTILYIYIFIERTEMPEIYIDGMNKLMLLIVAFWFGERLLRNTGITEFLIAYGKKKTSVDKDDAK